MISIVWITNYLLPEAVSQLEGTGEIKGTGGWILALSDALSSHPEIKISIVAISPLVKSMTRIQGKRNTYYAIPVGKGDSQYNRDYEMAYRRISAEVKPDVVHIHGTEYPHSLAALNAFGVERTIVTIQGLVSVCAPYYLAGLTRGELLRSLSFRDVIRGTVISEQRDMKRRGEDEIKLIQKVCYIGGRTSWDRENVWSINPDANYYHCGEVLRNEFYSGEWSFETCRPHSIFLSQASYPIKGLHKVLEALPIIKRQFPDVQLRVAGSDITYKNTTLMDRLRITTYGRIIKKMIKQKHLSENVSFIGPLNAEEMKREYMNANVFVCPSAIENSPNSLGEAQVLGVPCVASYVGGVMDMMKGDEKKLYRFEETGMLAAKICQVFEQEGGIDTSAMRTVARNRHDLKRVTAELLGVYKEIVSKIKDG